MCAMAALQLVLIWILPGFTISQRQCGPAMVLRARYINGDFALPMFGNAQAVSCVRIVPAAQGSMQINPLLTLQALLGGLIDILHEARL